MSTELEFHPLANAFPLLEGAEFETLVADIKANGQRELIVVFEDKILDGRNRYRACQVAGIAPDFTVFEGDDPVAFVVSMNIRRRHLDASQRAMVAAKLATLKRGDNQHSPIGETSQAEAADLLNVGKRSVERAAEVHDHGTPELVQAVEHGDVSVSAAAEVATLPEPEQRETLAGGDKAVKAKAKDLRAKRAKMPAAQKAREARRRKREAELEALRREREAMERAIQREVEELVSKLIELDRDIAHALYKVLSRDNMMKLEGVLEKSLGLNDAPDDTPNDDTHGRWTESDNLDEIRSASL